ncbi:MAG: pyridoxal phosphate-dependent aminotransferase [Chitinophagales bacterium]
MPKISQKGDNMPASPIRKLVPFAEQAKAKGTKIYHLNIGQPDIKTPTKMLDAVRNIDFDVLAYSHSAGFESYRRKLTGYYAKFGVDIDYSDLIVTTGGSEAILFGLLSCLDPDDEIIVPEPFYANYNGFAMTSNVTVKPITASIENGFALPSIAAFEAAITPKTKAVMICNPSNPTGYLYSKQELETLSKIVKKHDLFLFADEVYREFAYDKAQHHSILTLEGLEENAVVVDSISKRFSACGARIGMLVSRNKKVISTAMKFAQARLSPPTFAQVAAEASLEVEASYLEGVLAEYENRRNILVAGLNKIKDVVCPTPKGAFYVVAQLPIDDSERFCRWLLEDFNYEGETIMLAPASGFYATKGLGKQEVRIAYVLNENDLKKALVCLEKALEAYQNVM